MVGACIVGATGTSINIPGITGATIFSHGGTSSPSISGSTIVCTSGTLFNLVLLLSNFKKLYIPLCEGYMNYVFGFDEIGNNYTGKINATDISTTWSTQNEYDFCSMYGYSLGASFKERVPSDWNTNSSLWTFGSGGSLSGGKLVAVSPSVNHTLSLGEIIQTTDVFDVRCTVDQCTGSFNLRAQGVAGPTVNSTGDKQVYIIPANTWSNWVGIKVLTGTINIKISNFSVRKCIPSAVKIPGNPFTGKDCIGNVLSNPGIFSNSSLLN